MNRRALLVLAVAGSTLLGTCSGPDFVERVTFVNDSEYSAHTQVTDGQRSGWIGLTTVRPESTTTVERVIDQGEVWVFRFEYAGYEEEVRVPRGDLERSAWRVEVPASYAAALRSLGVPPPPE
jgi:major membrane immunogen (membrane-anchored lipoprotein)